MALDDDIEALRRPWGPRLYILGHHYQRDEVLRHADATGDSLELARRAAAARDAERIVFCGVHFMAESAAILARPGQAVYMPDIEAGCPMADMAPGREVERAWRDIGARRDTWCPVVYVNSAASLKAFCGERNGIACTSGNAAAVFRRVLESGRRILFIPDEHLGTNTALEQGVPPESLAVYDPGRPRGGLSPEQMDAARVLVWKGYCHVHAFAAADLEAARRRYPGATIIVHPETPAPVARLADTRGSTARIIRYADEAPDGATIVIGTEIHLVNRLARKHAGRVTIVPLRPSACRNMALTTEAKLLALLRDWPESARVRVPDPVAAPARAALERMLALP